MVKEILCKKCGQKVELRSHKNYAACIKALADRVAFLEADRQSEIEAGRRKQFEDNYNW